MAQVYSFVDDNGVTRLLAEIHPDPVFNGVDQWAQYGGESTLPDSTVTALDWGGLISGAALLNLASLTAPTVVTAGVYAVMVSVSAAAHAGGYAKLEVEVDSGGIDMGDFSVIPLTADGQVVPSVTVVSFCPAGGIISVHGVQTSGGNQTWDPSMIVQRVA